MTSIVESTTQPKVVVSRVPWQRICLSLLGIMVVMFQWRWATNHLYSLPAASVVSFTSITNNSMYVIGALVVFFVTGKVFYDWKMNTVQTITQEVRSTFDDIAPKHFDDPKIP